MARRRQHFDIIEAVPGGRWVLRWGGWLGIALLVVPAVVLAVLAATGTVGTGGSMVDWALALFALAALVGCGYGMVLLLASLRRITELAQVLCDRSNGPVLVKDVRHRYRFVNEAAASLVGRHPADILGRRDSELDPGPQALAYEENDAVCLERDLPTLFRESQHAPDGDHAFLVAKYPLHNTRGHIAGLVGVARDITDEIERRQLGRRRADELHVWFDLNPLPVVKFAGSDLRILEANPAAARCYGYEPQALLEMHLPDLFAPEEAERLHAYLSRERRVIPPGSVGWKHRKASGELFDVLTDMGSFVHEREPTHVMLVRDVSGEEDARKRLAASEARYDDLVESGLAMVWMHDLEGRLLHVNAAMAGALGHAREDMLGRMLSEFVADDAAQGWGDYLDRTMSVKRDAGLLHFMSSNGERRVWQYQFVCYPEAQPAPYVLASAQDVTLRHRYELRIRDQNRRDPLTGCRTRAFLDALTTQATADQIWGCVVVDVDYFRQLNASEGRERGDEVLRELAHVLAHHAGADDAVVRRGGDEFAIVIPQANANALRELTERLAQVSRDGMPAVFSLGWAIREAGEPLESTLRRADKMLLHGRARDLR